METITQLRTYVVVTCYKCGCDFGIPTHLRATLLETGQSFFCPNGHSQAYCESEVDRLKKQVDQEKRNAEWYRQQAETRGRARDRAEHQVRAYKGVITKTKRRIAHGVCPCCQRTFQDLARHMKGQHPDYAQTETT